MPGGRFPVKLTVSDNDKDLFLPAGAVGHGAIYTEHVEAIQIIRKIILRIGTWELLYNDDVPDGVAVSEAVALAKTLSTDESPSFINGLLGRLQQLKPSLLA